MVSNRASAAKMKLPHSDERFPVLTRVFSTPLVIVQVKKGESQEQAWHRYVKEHPADRAATVKVFNYLPL